MNDEGWEGGSRRGGRRKVVTEDGKLRKKGREGSKYLDMKGWEGMRVKGREGLREGSWDVGGGRWGWKGGEDEREPEIGRDGRDRRVENGGHRKGRGEGK